MTERSVYVDQNGPVIHFMKKKWRPVPGTIFCCGDKVLIKPFFSKTNPPAITVQRKPPSWWVGGSESFSQEVWVPYEG